jgi:Fur family transcriptional regulator, ferric uptake regulator
MSWVEHVLTHLSEQGHRVTEPRRAILECIVRYSQPFTTEQLFKDLGGEQGPIGRATVYRTVDLLLADHWLARVHWSPAKDSVADDHAYVPVEQGHQHHMVCKHCGSAAARCFPGTWRNRAWDARVMLRACASIGDFWIFAWASLPLTQPAQP